MKDPKIPEKKIADATNPIITSNGYKLTNETIDAVKDCLCLFCSEPFVESPDIILTPVTRKGHIYKYHYYCPECANYFNEQKAKQRSLH
jgi:hypothetical protein